MEPCQVRHQGKSAPGNDTSQASRQACCSSCLTYFEFALLILIALKGIIPLTFIECSAIVPEST